MISNVANADDHRLFFITDQLLSLPLHRWQSIFLNMLVLAGGVWFTVKLRFLCICRDNLLFPCFGWRRKMFCTFCDCCMLLNVFESYIFFLLRTFSCWVLLNFEVHARGDNWGRGRKINFGFHCSRTEPTKFIKSVLVWFYLIVRFGPCGKSASECYFGKIQFRLFELT